MLKKIRNLVLDILWLIFAELIPIYGLIIASYTTNNGLVDFACFISILWIFGAVYKTMGSIYKKSNELTNYLKTKNND